MATANGTQGLLMIVLKDHSWRGSGFEHGAGVQTRLVICQVSTSLTEQVLFFFFFARGSVWVPGTIWFPKQHCKSPPSTEAGVALKHLQVWSMSAKEKLSRVREAAQQAGSYSVCRRRVLSHRVRSNHKQQQKSD